ncbi:MAG: hypothetical protein GX206_08040 [Clostridiales bacterium]|nr:hypothetical protein [Clostridiales bacterium]
MALQFSREYKRIIEEIADGLSNITDVYSILDMEKTTWEDLCDQDKIEFTKTLADDIFYALGQEPIMIIGDDKVEYSKEKGEINIISQNNVIKSVKL